MFLPEFGLAMQPFGISPRLEFLYKSGAFEESIAHLVYGLDNSEAIVMITGAIGTGKTMAIQSFLSYLGDRYVSALVTNTSVDSKELLKLVLEDLGHQAAPGSDKSDLLIAFKNLLVATGREGKRIVIVIDEAQNLSREVLEEVRLLTNLGQGDEQPVQIILVGQPELETAVQRPDLAQLKQRIRVHYKLAPLSRSELQQYVDHRMTVAGGEAGVFTNGALDRVSSLSRGVPRVVNTLCGEALLSAYVAGRRKVEAVDLDEHANKPAPAAPRDEPERVHVVKPEPEIQHREMAVRREPKPEPVRVEPPVVQQAAVPAAQRGSRTGWRWAVAVVGLAAIVVALVATGQLQSFWSRLPFAGASSGPTVTQAAPQTAVSEVRSSAVPAGSMDPADMDTTPVMAKVSDAGTGLAADDATVAPGDSKPVEAAKTTPGESALPANNLPASAAAAGTPVAASTTIVEPTGDTAAADGEHYIHVSSFRTAEHAAEVARQFTAEGLLASVRPQLVRDVQWYRVYLGPFATHDDAVRLANHLRDQGTITYYKVLRLGADDGS
ncbi:MAG: AAA family ATPase [bacterium]|nr:AAA family ATPase [bacterium]